MVNIKKRDGRTEEFSASKLERSLRSSGTSEQVAREIAAHIQPREGMSVDEVRSETSRALRERDAEAAERYDSTRQMVARTAVEAAKGTVRMSEEAMRRLHVSPGESLELAHSGHTHKVRAERAPDEVRGIQLNAAELNLLGAKEGTRVTVHRRG